MIVATAFIVAVGFYALMNSGLAPIETRQDKTTKAATQNVEVHATTFNGNIEIQPATDGEIEVIYNVEAPIGHISEITTSTTNQTQEAETLITAKAEIANAGNTLKVNYKANILIKLPTSSRYNLTLETSNGNIIKPQLNDNVLVAKTDNGNINIEDENCTLIDASSDNGKVSVSLAEGTLFHVDAVTGNGHVSYQGIAMNTSIQTDTHLVGYTTAGAGNLELTLSSANGDVTIQYFAK